MHQALRTILQGGAGSLDERFDEMPLIQAGEPRDFPIILMGRDPWKPLMDFVFKMADTGALDPRRPSTT